MRFLLAKAPCKAIVVACGTVSANALPALRAQFDVPVIGVIEPAVRAAVGKSKNKRIGVIATAATVASHAYEDALTTLCPEIEVISRACPLFVPLVENGLIQADDSVTLEVARRYLSPIGAFGADTLILGCTHFPIISESIKRILPDVTLINSGREAALALSEATPAHSLEGRGSLTCYVSDNPENFRDVASIFLGERFDAPICKIDIERY
jgi:glutamate racemase